MKITTAILFILLSSSAWAQDTDGDGSVTILVPLAFSSTVQILPGAQGTLWTGELWIQNDSATGLSTFQPGGNEPPLPLPNPVAYPAGFVGQMGGVASNHGDGGALLEVPRAIAPDIHVSMRLLELSRNAQPTGVDVPVIREHQFFKRPTSYLGIPSSSAVRSALRVYDPRQRHGSAVRADFLAPDGAVVASAVLRPGDDPILGNAEIPRDYPYPGFDAIYSITDTFPQLRAYERFHIRLTPLDPTTEYWAFVSVTHNETQHVLLITDRSE